jgi:5-methylcytosine-specific restriction endonuclease McrA
LSKEGYKKEKRTLWECKELKSLRRDYFNECLIQLFSITETALPKDDRPVTPSMRKDVWSKCVDNKCEVCETEISEDAFEAGHIRARSLGGQTELDNLIPICFDCNRGMGTGNPYDYKKVNYPHLCS